MNKIIDYLSNMLVEKRTILFAGLFILTIALSFFMKNLGIENSLEVWFLKDDPTLINYNDSKRIYGTDEIIFAWMQPSSGNIYDKSFIQKIYKASDQLRNYEHIKRVYSVTSAPHITSSGNELTVDEMVTKYPDKTYVPDELRKKIEANPLWKKMLLNKKSSSVVMLIEPVVSKDIDALRPQIIENVKKNLSGLNYKLAGMGVIYDELNRLSMKDFSVFTSLTYIILVLVLFLFFRKLSVLFASVITIFLSTTLFFGIAGIFHIKFDMISIILPALIIILSLADLIHIFSHYDKMSPGSGRLKRTLTYVILPCLFTSLTTAIGLSSIASSPMKILKTFGIFAAIGVMLEFFVAIIVSSFFLGRREKKEAGTEQAVSEVKNIKIIDFIDVILVKITNFVQKKYLACVIAAIAILIFSIVGLMQLSVDTNTLGFLMDSNQVKKDARFIEKDYGKYFTMEVRLFPKSSDGVKDPAFLRKLEKFQNVLDKEKDFEKTTSLVDIVKYLNQVLIDNKEKSYRIPDSTAAVSQELLLYDMDEDNDLYNFVSDDYSELRFITRISIMSAKELEKVKIKAENLIKKHFEGTADYKFGGYLPLYVKLIDYITQSQIRSFLLAISIIFLVMGLLFRTYRVVLMGIVPNILPIFITLGIMGWAGILLDLGTVTIAALAIGVAVDDTIHFIFMYIRKRKEGVSVKESIEHTLNTSGKAIVITSSLLVVGYSVMLLASVTSVVNFGLLIIIAMISALICDIILLPSILLLFGKNKKSSI